ncbi:NADP-dependent oxidoreductase [Gryllotalpicola reticulitermitis]|uniref:NADP-dependent oxidoreductase n=1 Tax=Gryllotalpicola reticulitermitis TaxID=1184153 RepID=A0ABV8Q986_9MICO
MTENAATGGAATESGASASAPTRKTARAVRFDRYGDRDVLYVADVPMPEPKDGEVLVEVRAAGINPGEAAIRNGAMHDRLPATFPSGEGSDLAGVVVALGAGVTDFAVGDEVLGYSWERSSHATHATVPVTQLIRKPPELSWEVAGALYIAGCTAYAAVRAVDPQAGETVAVSGAAGGVGSIVVQLLRHRGVRVLGIASAASAETVAGLGATPVAYGDGLADRLTAASADGIDAFIDLYGPEYVRLAIELGIAPERIETIISFGAAQEFGTKSDGSGDASTREVLSEVASLVAEGAVTVPIAASYPLDRIRDAFEELEKRHTHGKIVLIP